MEKELSTAFHLAEKWHAVVLIDEADVFLEQRKSKNLVHNGLVSGEYQSHPKSIDESIPAPRVAKLSVSIS